MNNQTISKELAEKLHQMGIEGESEKWWEWYISTENLKTTDIPHKLVYLPNRRKPETLTNAQHYPAYNLQELLLLMPKIGEVLGWKQNYFFANINAVGEGEEYWFGSDCKNDEPEWKAISHQLLDLYIETKDFTKIDEYLLDLLKNNE
jgi:hypothetical protein